MNYIMIKSIIFLYVTKIILFTLYAIVLYIYNMKYKNIEI